MSSIARSQMTLERLAGIDRLWPDAHSKSGGPPLEPEEARRPRSRALTGPTSRSPCPEDPDTVMRLAPLLNTARALALPSRGFRSATERS
jgi:hypothetical protein